MTSCYHGKRQAATGRLFRSFGGQAPLEIREDRALGTGSSMAACQICYVRQKKPLGLGHAVWCAKQHIGDEYFAVLLGDDIVFRKPCLKQMIEVYDEAKKPVVAIRRVPREDVSSYGVMNRKTVGRGLWEISDLVENLAPKMLRLTLQSLAVTCASSIFPVLENLEPGRVVKFS